MRELDLWRSYPTQPYGRWACRIAPAPGSAVFRVVESDPAVADPGFLATLHDTMTAPTPGRTGRVEGNTIVDGWRTLPVGHPGHFGEAARAVPGAYVGGRRP